MVVGSVVLLTAYTLIYLNLPSDAQFGDTIAVSYFDPPMYVYAGAPMVYDAISRRFPLGEVVVVVVVVVFVVIIAFFFLFFLSQCLVSGAM